MLTWKIYSATQKILSPEWEAVISDLLGVEIHSQRRIGYVSAREALRLSLLEYKIQTTPSDLELSGFDSLRKWPHFTLSLSHSKKAGAAALGLKVEYRSLGIDIELEDRFVKKDILARISHPEDIQRRPIEIWCLKEAAFKCCMNSGYFERPIEFSSIIIKENEWKHVATGLTGSVELHLLEGHVLALATMKQGLSTSS